MATYPITGSQFEAHELVGLHVSKIVMNPDGLSNMVWSYSDTVGPFVLDVRTINLSEDHVPE